MILSGSDLRTGNVCSENRTGGRPGLEVAGPTNCTFSRNNSREQRDRVSLRSAPNTDRFDNYQ